MHRVALYLPSRAGFGWGIELLYYNQVSAITSEKSGATATVACVKAPAFTADFHWHWSQGMSVFTPGFVPVHENKER